ncbi:MAG: hypothetical protein RLZZ624_1137 [Cyanobacteriota bacterium]
MSATSSAAGPLSAADAAKLAGARLGPGERPQLNQLAHSRRPRQEIAGRRQGTPPDGGAIVAWAQRQPLLAEDPHFRAAFCRQLLSSAELLRQIGAATSAEDLSPLALELEQLIEWCEQHSETPAQSR